MFEIRRTSRLAVGRRPDAVGGLVNDERADDEYVLRAKKVMADKA